MAIVKSIFLGRCKNKVDEDAYYRTTKGRTHLCYVKSPMNAQTRANLGVSIHAFTFGAIAKFAKEHAADISVSFDATKYGTPRNNFCDLNYKGFRAAMQSLFEANEGSLDGVTAAQIEDAVESYASANPTSILRVKKTGYDDVYLKGAWSSNDNPVEPEVEDDDTTGGGGTGDGGQVEDPLG